MDMIMDDLLANFASVDTNGDGLLSFAEASVRFSDLTQAEFDALDSNKDGFLSETELGGTTTPETGCALGKAISGDRLGDFFLLGLSAMVMLGWGGRRNP